MGLKFRPVDNTFYDLFTESAQHLVLGAGLLAEMLSEGADHDDVARRMREAEHEADETTHAIIRRVNSTFVTPFDREDIYRLASSLDDVLDYIEEAADRIRKLADQGRIGTADRDIRLGNVESAQSRAELELINRDLDQLGALVRLPPTSPPVAGADAAGAP